MPSTSRACANGSSRHPGRDLRRCPIRKPCTVLASGIVHNGEHVMNDRTNPEPLVGVVNAGSSSLKFAVYEGERCILSGQVEGIGVHPSAKAKDADGQEITPPDLGAKLPST